MKLDGINKVLVVGNIASGKTILAKKLATIYNLPIYHVDSIQFEPGMKVKAHKETQKIIDSITDQDKWIIDGFGPLNRIEYRFQCADKIIFVDLPVFNSYLWCIKRQLKSIWKKREELPDGCNEVTFAHTYKLFKTINNIHTKMRPELIKMFNRPNLINKVAWIKSTKELNKFY